MSQSKLSLPNFNIISSSTVSLPPMFGGNVESNSSPEEVVPKEHQTDHFFRIFNIISKYHCFVDTSVMGAGKTYNVGYICQKAGLSLLVVAPRKAIDLVWGPFCKKHGITVIDMLSYDDLRATVRTQGTLKHGLLHRFDNKETGRTVFHPTDKLSTIAKAGVLLVFDECHKLKNASDQTNAATVLAAEFTRAIGQSGSKSRLGFLSASPFDKEEHSIQMARIMGFITHSKLYMNINGAIVLSTSKGKLGAQELIDICSFYDSDITRQIVDDTKFDDKKSIEPMCFQLFSQVIMPTLSSAMPGPQLTAKKVAYNGYYKMRTQEGEEKMRALLADLASASVYNNDTGTINTRLANYGAIQTALVGIELMIVDEIIDRLIEEDMKQPNGKSLIFINFPTTSLPILEKRLAAYNPVMMVGKVKQKDRPALMEKFNNDPTCRVFIGTIKVAGESLSLDDTVGDQPRKTYIIPNYSVLDLHQASGRTYRANTKSDATVINVYAKLTDPKIVITNKVKDNLIRQSKILHALARKTDVLETILPQQVEDGIKFPGDYEEVIED